MEVGKSLFVTLKRLSRLFFKSNISFCLIGGLALGMVAKPRSTEDIDLLVLLDEDQRESIALIIRKHFRIIEIHSTVMQIGRSRVWRIVLQDPYHEGGIVILDVVFADNTIYRNAVKNSVPVQVDAVTIPVVKPEDLILIKMLSGRDQDKLDIQLIRSENPDLDEEYIRTWQEFV